MSDIDNELRALLDTAGGSPTLTQRDTLLDSLMARIDEGGTDVATAPAPPTPLEPASTETTIKVSARGAARAAGVGMGGWLALAAGAAAAATATAWLVERPVSPDANPVPSIEAPQIIDVRAQGSAGIDAIIPGIVAPDVASPLDEGSTAPQTPATALPQGAEGADAPTGTSPAGAAGGSAGRDEAWSAPDNGSSAGDAGSTGAGDGAPAPEPGVGIDVKVPLGDVEDTVKDAVDGLLPAGPVKDTVAPVIHAVDVSGLASWVVDSLLCGTTAPMSVDASDNTDVTAASLRVTTSTGHTQRLSLAKAGGSTWTGVLAPITALDLGLLDPLVRIDVEVRDAAGNTAVAQRTAQASIASCLLG